MHGTAVADFADQASEILGTRCLPVPFVQQPIAIVEIVARMQLGFAVRGTPSLQRRVPSLGSHFLLVNGCFQGVV